MELRRVYLEGLPDGPCDAYRARVLLCMAEVLAERLGLATSALGESELSGLAESVGPCEEELRVALVEFAERSEGGGSEPLAEPAAKTSRAKKEKSEWLSSDLRLAAAHRLGQALDYLQAIEIERERKRHGSYFTPVQVARTLIGRALEQSEVRQGARICDPACGGGAFLLEAAAGALARRAQDSGGQGFYLGSTARREAAGEVYGVDRSALAVAVARAALWLFVGDDSLALSGLGEFRKGDALVGKVWQAEQPNYGELLREGGEPFEFHQAFPEVFCGGAAGFDWVVGNPPWVAFQGRATQKIPPELRSYYRANFRAFKGYPTLHGLFVERASRLAPSGAITLLIPSSVSDLDGYVETRASLTECHEPQEPLLEFGQDAFSGVVQPCFGLIANPRAVAGATIRGKAIGALNSESEKEGPGAERRALTESNRGEAPGRAWVLEERARAKGEAAPVVPPACLQRLATLPPLPPEVFREMGFQSNRVVASELFLRAEKAKAPFIVPMLEGRRVGEFQQRAPGLFVNPDKGTLKRTRCRLRAAEDYERVDFVVRQTAAYTIASLHGEHRFRNSLIGGFAHGEFDAPLLVGLLNSALFRALHLSSQRDARQATFPQVKLSHLRRLPAPPQTEAKRDTVRALSEQASRLGGLSADQRVALDDAVFALFELSESDARDVRGYLQKAAPKSVSPSL